MNPEESFSWVHNSTKLVLAIFLQIMAPLRSLRLADNVESEYRKTVSWFIASAAGCLHLWSLLNRALAWPRIFILGEMVKLNESADGVTFSVRVQPRARRNALVGELGDALKLALTAPPVDGRANRACIEFFAEALHLPRSSFRIASGESSRNKVIRVSGITAAELRKRFQARADAP